jgi:hypothetical protein
MDDAPDYDTFAEQLDAIEAKLDRLLAFAAFVEETVKPFTEGKNAKYLALLAMKKAGGRG